jgi:hypothetical protein
VTFKYRRHIYYAFPSLGIRHSSGLRDPDALDDDLQLLGSALRGGGAGGQKTKNMNKAEVELLSGLRNLLTAFGEKSKRSGRAGGPADVNDNAQRPSKHKRRQLKRASETGGLLGALQKLVARTSNGGDSAALIDRLVKLVAAAEAGKLHPGANNSRTTRTAGGGKGQRPNTSTAAKLAPPPARNLAKPRVREKASTLSLTSNLLHSIRIIGMALS